MNVAPLLVHRFGVVTLRSDVFEARNEELNRRVGFRVDHLDASWLERNPLARTIALGDGPPIEEFRGSPRQLVLRDNPVPAMRARTIRRSEVPPGLFALEALPLEDEGWLMTPYETDGRLTVLGLVVSSMSDGFALSVAGVAASSEHDDVVDRVETDDGRCVVVVRRPDTDRPEEYTCHDGTCEGNGGCAGHDDTDPDQDDLARFWCQCHHDG